jgi:hypothetical protein
VHVICIPNHTVHPWFESPQIAVPRNCPQDRGVASIILGCIVELAQCRATVTPRSACCIAVRPSTALRGLVIACSLVFSRNVAPRRLYFRDCCGSRLTSSQICDEASGLACVPSYFPQGIRHHVKFSAATLAALTHTFTRAPSRLHSPQPLDPPRALVHPLGLIFPSLTRRTNRPSTFTSRPIAPHTKPSLYATRQLPRKHGPGTEKDEQHCTPQAARRRGREPVGRHRAGRRLTERRFRAQRCGRGRRCRCRQ